MAANSFTKLFSIEEANEMIPRLEMLIARLQAGANFLRRELRELAETRPLERGDVDTLIRERPELRTATDEIAAIAVEIEGFGCLVKDIDLGLVDFPGELDNEVVFLCWQSGEPEIAAWHPLDEGFSSRRALKGARKTYLN